MLLASGSADPFVYLYDVGGPKVGDVTCANEIIFHDTYITRLGYWSFTTTSRGTHRSCVCGRFPPHRAHPMLMFGRRYNQDLGSSRTCKEEA
jgi:hypothetical protein